MRWVPFLSLFLGATAAAADSGLYAERPPDFSLSVSHHRLDLNYGGTSVDTTVDRIGVAWRERFGERLELGLAGGYSFLTQSNNPPLAGRELSGYHAGFLLDLDLLTYARGRLSLHGAWLYQKMDDDNGTQQIVISWREPSATLRASARISDALDVFGGIRYGVIDGTQRLEGTINETREISQTDRSGGFAGVQLNLEDNGYLGVTTATGIDRYTSIYFGRRF